MPGRITVVTASAAATTDHAAGSNTQTLSIGQGGAQSVTFGSAPSVVVGGTGVVSATGSDGGTVSYSTVSADCSVGSSSGVVTGLHAGSNNCGHGVGCGDDGSCCRVEHANTQHWSRGCAHTHRFSNNGHPGRLHLRRHELQPNYSWQVVSLAGAATIDGAGHVAVTGLVPGASTTVTVTTSNSDYVDGTLDVSGTALSLPTGVVVALPDLPSQFVIGQDVVVKVEVSSDGTGRAGVPSERSQAPTPRSGQGINGTVAVTINGEYACTATVVDGVDPALRRSRTPARKVRCDLHGNRERHPLTVATPPVAVKGRRQPCRSLGPKRLFADVSSTSASPVETRRPTAKSRSNRRCAADGSRSRLPRVARTSCGAQVSALWVRCCTSRRMTASRHRQQSRCESAKRSDLAPRDADRRRSDLELRRRREVLAEKSASVVGLSQNTPPTPRISGSALGKAVASCSASEVLWSRSPSCARTRVAVAIRESADRSGTGTSTFAGAGESSGPARQHDVQARFGSRVDPAALLAPHLRSTSVRSSRSPDSIAAPSSRRRAIAPSVRG